MLTVSSPGDGKTLTAVHLAGAVAQSEKRRVLLHDANFHASCLAERLGLEPRRGLAEVLVSDVPLDSAWSVVVTSLPFGLCVLLAGTSTRSPYEISARPAFTP